MSGSPTEGEIQTQWRNAVAILEATRNYADSTLAGPGGLLDVFLQSLEGEFLPVGGAGAAQRMRNGMSSLVEPSRALQFLDPVLREYGNLITSGGGYTSLPELSRALYEHFHTNGLTVKGRGITFDTTATAGGSNVGNGTVSRLTIDERGYPLESCHVETKRLRCRGDRNSGQPEHAELFEVIGEAASQDALLRASYGSGDRRATLTAKHAGSVNGGSLLRNSSWSTYNAAATPKFADWTEVAGGAQIEQSATFYRSHPNSTGDFSLRINGGGGTVTLRQSLESMRVQRLDPETPYFLRIMVNKTVGTAVGGSVTIRMGSRSVTTTIAALGSGWQEITFTPGSLCWFRSFNQNPFRIEVEWSGSTSGYLLVDDAIFVPWDRADGTYWVIRQNAASPVSWLLDDTLDFTDTGGAPATAKIQWWYWVAGLGYLPSTTGTPTLLDP